MSMIYTRLKFRAASTILLRAVTRTPYRPTGTSSAGGTNGAGFRGRWKVLTGSRKLMKATGATIAAVSTVAYFHEKDKTTATVDAVSKYLVVSMYAGM